MVPITRAKAGLQALLRRFQRFQKFYRRLCRCDCRVSKNTNIDTDNDSQWSESGGLGRRSSFYLFITLWLRELSGHEILLLGRRITSECEVRLATRNGSVGVEYPARDIITNCVVHLSDVELTLVQQRIMREWERRETVAREELVKERADSGYRIW